MKLFDYYTESNCNLECAWQEAASVCGCKPWFVPSLEAEKMCFLLGNICFEQIMNLIENEERQLKCDCPRDCVYSKYSMSVSDRVIKERLTTRRWTNASNGDGFYKIGTDEQDGNDFSGSHWYNMGRISKIKISRMILNIKSVLMQVNI